jgi:AmpD protein
MSKFQITDEGWLQITHKTSIKKVVHKKSPNCDQRPDEADICLIVVHGISLPPNQFGGHYIEQLFCNQLNPADHEYFMQIKDLCVSSHLLIRRDGQVMQFVPFTQRAWHAGISHWKERERCNDFSIGIELEGADDIEYEDIQYHQLNDILKTLKFKYPNIGTDAVGGHNDIAPGRKTDPGDAFEWHRLKEAQNN